ENANSVAGLSPPHSSRPHAPPAPQFLIRHSSSPPLPRSHGRLFLLPLAMPALGGVVLLVLGLGLGFFVPRWAGLVGGPRVYTSANLLQEVKTVSELVTVQYVIEKVVVVEDIKWVAGLGENRVLLLAHGVVKAGLDLGRLQPADLQVTDKRVV